MKPTLLDVRKLSAQNRVTILLSHPLSMIGCRSYKKVVQMKEFSSSCLNVEKKKVFTKDLCMPLGGKKIIEEDL